MERCPNCGQLSRLGAKFCTTCGNKLTGEEVVPSAPSGETVQAPEPHVQVEVTESPPTLIEGQVSGWPAAPATNAAPADLTWPANGTSSTPVESTGEAVTGEEWPSDWSTEEATWPVLPTRPEPSSDDSAEASEGTAAMAEQEQVQEPETATGATEQPDTGVAGQGLDEGTTEGTAEEERTSLARDRAAQLLDELREVITALGGEAPPDLSGVISELEVAVTPPGAIGSEELSELREALLKARERPRDLDTIVDLTGRIDDLVALVIAYDRTIAAIERSLEALRGDG